MGQRVSFGCFSGFSRPLFVNGMQTFYTGYTASSRAACTSNLNYDPASIDYRRISALYVPGAESGAHNCFLWVDQIKPTVDPNGVYCGANICDKNYEGWAITDMTTFTCEDTALLGTTCDMSSALACNKAETGLVCGKKASGGLTGICYAPNEDAACVRRSSGGDYTCLQDLGCSCSTGTCTRGDVGSQCTSPNDFSYSEGDDGNTDHENQNCAGDLTCTADGSDYRCEDPDYGLSCPNVPSGLASRRRARSALEGRQSKQDASWSCPSGQTQCAIQRTSGFECVITEYELENCGSCGIACTAIPGAYYVGCAEGRCHVATCRQGYKLVDDTHCEKL